MRWGKSLTQLIVIFIILNIFLGISNYNKNIKAYTLTQRRIENVKKLLSDKGITIETSFLKNFKPQRSIWLVPIEMTSQKRDKLVSNLLTQDSSQITITKGKSEELYHTARRIYTKGDKRVVFQGNSVFYSNNIVENLGQQELKNLPLNLNREEALSLAKAFVKKIDLDNIFEDYQIKDYQVSYRVSSDGAEVTYYTVYENRPIFNSYLRMQINSEGVYEAYMQVLEVVEKEKAVEPIYPLDKVLLGIRDSVEQYGETSITEIQLGYAMQNKRGMHILKEEAVPVYKITLEGLEEEIFVNAYTNLIMQNEME